MKYLLPIIGTVALLIVSCANFPTEEQLIKTVAVRNVHKITISSPEGIGTCSSVFVKYKEKVRHITNAHCCKGDITFDGNPATIVKTTPQVDLCEITHNIMPRTGIDMAADGLEVADKVYIVGFPSGYDLSISEGHVTVRFRLSQFLTPLTQTNAWAYYGNSGGAAISSNGRLVGITSMILVEHKHAAYVPLNILKEFLNK